ncbi:hypothetical protein [Bordetella bronchiseptica]|uniref:hypothetical protein n=1 Tax=Bordetella bronchiseptica TaxID=518 RepID=UPI0012697A86|nr:hypothetical protein [Bordetella bronchiseptica]
MLRGFVGNMLNPKVLLFCSVFLPQFLRLGPVAPRMMVRGAILVVFGLLVDLALGLFQHAHRIFPMPVAGLRAVRPAMRREVTNRRARRPCHSIDARRR